jgi:hypothetical protein
VTSASLWPDSRPVVDAAIALLPTIGDDLTAETIEVLCTTIVGLREQLRAKNDLLSASLAMLHGQRIEIHRLRTQQDRLLAECRQSRGSVA